MRAKLCVSLVVAALSVIKAIGDRKQYSDVANIRLMANIIKTKKIKIKIKKKERGKQAIHVGRVIACYEYEIL